MATDLIRYDLLVQNALRGVVRKVLTDAAREGVPGEHHYYVSFLTGAPGVRISNRLREKYPDEMTIVLQHQFWDLGVTEHSFEVGLAFGGIPERLLVPFEAVTGFFDPSVQFALKFEALTGDAADDDQATGSEGVPQLEASNPTPNDVVRDIGKRAGKGSRKDARTGVPALTGISTTGAGAPPALPAPAAPQPLDAITPLPKRSVDPDAKPSESPTDKPRDDKSSDAKAKPKGDGKPEKPASAEVLSLDAFRKKS